MTGRVGDVRLYLESDTANLVQCCYALETFSQTIGCHAGPAISAHQGCDLLSGDARPDGLLNLITDLHYLDDADAALIAGVGATFAADGTPHGNGLIRLQASFSQHARWQGRGFDFALAAVTAKDADEALSHYSTQG